jgi:hypothetical protein
MKDRTRGASPIETLRLALGPGASAMVQLAAVVAGKGHPCRRPISVAGFYFPYRPGFPVLAYRGRKPQPPSIVRETSSSP